MKKAPYSAVFKEQALRKVCQRDGRTIKVIASELNLPVTTLKGWLQAAKREQKMTTPQSPKRPEDWLVEARLLALQESHGLSENELHAWCRSRGIFAHHLSQWRADFCDQKRTETGSGLQEIRELKQANQKLERELARKEKALAEAAALLILQKKCHALWEDEAG